MGRDPNRADPYAETTAATGMQPYMRPINVGIWMQHPRTVSKAWTISVTVVLGVLCAASLVSLLV